jgi:hypothetical protein
MEYSRGLERQIKSKDEEIAGLKARIAELERERGARLRVAVENRKQRRPESRGAVVQEDTKLKKLIRRLDSPDSDNEAAGALRALARELQARGRGFAAVGNRVHLHQ